MNPDRDRDRLLEDALTHELRAAATPPATDTCLDAETVAAWMDGGLAPDAMVMAEAHASNCARCQALLGTVARTAPAAAVPEPRTARLWRWWFAPLAATAAAVTLWMVVPQEPATNPVFAPASESALATPPPPPAIAPPAAPAPSPPPAATALGRERASAQAERREAPVAKAAEAQSAPPPPPTMPETVTVVDSAASAPAGITARADAAITARSAPSPAVIWLVGRAGLVRLATDGRTFVPVPFPEAVDLIAVTATDARTATVTDVDGRVFETRDGGRTWTRP